MESREDDGVPSGVCFGDMLRGILQSENCKIYNRMAIEVAFNNLYFSLSKILVRKMTRAGSVKDPKGILSCQSVGRRTEWKGFGLKWQGS